MTDYYCDLGQGYADKSGVDHTGNQYLGPGGLQAAIRGTGLATALSAGDVVHVAGTADQALLVLLRGGKDISGWSLGATVVDNDTGAKWSGVVCQVNVGVNTDVLVELASGDEDSITLADGINNTTDSDTTTLASKSTPGLHIDTLWGDNSSGPIELRGCDAAWTDYAAVFGLDGGGKAAHNVSLDGKSYIRLAYAAMTNAAGSGLYCSGGNYNSVHHVAVDGAGSHGIEFGGSPTYLCAWTELVVVNSGANAINGAPRYGFLLADSVIAGNAGLGIDPTFGGDVANCLIYDNSGHGVVNSTNLTATRCTIDDNGGDGVYADAGAGVGAVTHSRISNNAGYGINCAAGAGQLWADWNVLGGNVGGDTNNVTDRGNSLTSQTPAQIGYRDQAGRDYRLTRGAVLAGPHAAAVDLDWYNAAQRAYLTAGAQPIRYKRRRALLGFGDMACAE